MKWGLVGYGEITPHFIKSLLAIDGQEIDAIASISKHDELAKKTEFKGIDIYDDYNLLYDNSDIEIVYISTTNNLHKDIVIKCLRSGKHVLCEKPLGICKDDVSEMVATSKECKKFLMEGMWTRFLPAYKKFISLIKGGTIGIPQFAIIDFGFYSTWGNERRLLNKDLCGGSLLDNTDYNIFACIDIFNSLPSEFNSLATFSETGVENKCSINLKFPNGGMAQIFSSFVQQTNQDAIVYGSIGSIKLKEFWHGQEIELNINDQQTKNIKLPFRSSGFYHEIQDVISCINANKLESSIIPHSLSISIASIIDEIFEQIKK